ncbi:39S ribosomal protein L46 [Tropilaelaps mercedesae]|uniref:39S ribosomal protein L46, mitochondrial n=1 Tax=Tropilaelaps mercedesae TaxID=418985 RepID=A0A1V9Y3K3_9ACAR|nr:39S ribosomal protein L46 [Tropilaelaps mercedesae]
MLASGRRLGLLVASVTQVRQCFARTASTWQIAAGAVLERPAIIVRPFNALEMAYVDLLGELETEQSLLSDHELKVKEEEEQIRSRSGKPASGAPLRVKLTGDFVKEWTAELEAFRNKYPYKPSNLGLNDVNRHIDQALTLLVKQKLGPQEHWLFPQTNHVEGETLRQTAERAVKECFGGSVSTRSIGNAPIALHKYKYPKALQQQSGKEGVKVFFMKMLYNSGKPVLNEAFGSDMIWATHHEMLEHLPSALKKSVRKAFFVQPNIDFTKFLELIAEKGELRKRRLLND